MISEQIFIDFIREIGFPVFVAIYLMVKMEKTIKENTNALKELKKCIEKA